MIFALLQLKQDMCGIAGYFSKSTDIRLQGFLKNAGQALSKRGPDFQKSVILSPNAGFVHARLSIIDPSSVANQPMEDDTGRYTIIFNGEIFNFRELRQQFLADLPFRTTSDTEVLLQMYIRLGKDCLKHLNGFFAFAVFDKQSNSIFLARDRFGIKPMHIYCDDNMTVFASELKAIFQFPIKRQLDYNTLALYLQLNYVPGEYSMIQNIKKLKPAHFATISSSGIITTAAYYDVPYKPGEKISSSITSYDSAKSTLKKLIEESVVRRLVSDVPLGTFLSGGTDSSVITSCAAKHVKGLNTFSIGYKDEPYFDETKYANLVALRCGTHHTVYPVSNNEMFEQIFSVLDYIDEPFADSSALAVYILSQKTRQKVTVALSGDGGDELFAGYNKHKAEMRARAHSVSNLLLQNSLPLLKMLPKSRHSRLGNLFRQLERFSEGLQLSAAQRYWRWCVLNPQPEALKLLRNQNFTDTGELEKRKSFVLDAVKENGDLNDVLFADVQMILPGDMLTKVDLMSMANSLEVRVPLLDYTVVDFAFSLPVEYKINGSETKKILKDAFREDLPPEIFDRPKHGFEVPLLKWLRSGLKPLTDELLSRDFISNQQIFEYAEIEKVKQKINSDNPGDVHAHVWGLLVFQYWYKKYFTAHA